MSKRVFERIAEGLEEAIASIYDIPDDPEPLDVRPISRNSQRNPTGYMTAYMRKYRARKRMANTLAANKGVVDG